MEKTKKTLHLRRQYDADFKESAVKLLLNGQSVPCVSQSLGIEDAFA